MTISPPDVLLGARTPRYRSVPPAATTAGREACDLIASAGQPLDGWQCDTLDGGLGERPDGRWATSEVAMIVARQNGKGGILEAKTLHSLYLTPTKLILFSAHEFKTARRMFLRIRGLISGCHDLSRRVKTIRTSHGEEGVELLDGSELCFVARSRGSGRGFDPQEIVLDEAYALTDEQMAAMMPSVSAQKNPQLWYASSHPPPSAEVLRRICRRGRAGSSSMAYFEWSADPDCESDDERALAEANPALGIRISAESAERERGSMSDEDYRRERLGIVQLDDNVDRVFGPGAWDAVADPESRIERRYGFAVDVPPTRRSTAIAVAGIRADGLTHVEIVQVGQGTKWAAKRIKDLLDKWGGEIALDPHAPAGGLIPDLAELGIEPRLINGGEFGRACGWMYDQVTGELIRHLGQPELDSAVSGAVPKDTGDGAYRWSRTKSTVDISPLCAATIAAWIVAGEPGEYNVLESIW